MADPPYPDLGGAGDGADLRLDRGTAGTPRWVKVLGIVVVVLLLLFVVLQLTGGGGAHSPARHASGGYSLSLFSASAGDAR